MSRIDPAPVVPQAPGDIVIGGPSGHPTLLHVGSEGQQLDVLGGLPSWRDAVLPAAAEMLAGVQDGSYRLHLNQNDIPFGNAGYVSKITGPVGDGMQLRKGKNGQLQWEQGPWYNVADFLTAGSTDHTAELKSLIDSHGAGHYRIPLGFTVNIPLTNVVANTVQIRDGVFIDGEGPGSVISVTGYGSNPGSTYYAIGVDWNVQTADINSGGIRNLTILGDGPGATQTWTNRQASAVRVLGFNKVQKNLFFQDVIFKNHDGFPLHADTGALQEGAIVHRCQFINCGNGLNYNTDFTTVRSCTFINSEGIENSGAANVVEANIFINVFGAAISSGGNQSSGANKRVFPGGRIVHNLIFNVLGGGSYGTGVGIILAQSSPSQLVAFNYVQGTYSTGIQTTHDSSGNLADDQLHIVAYNELVSCGNSGTGGGALAMWIATANTRIIGNHIFNRPNNTGDYYPLPSGSRTTGGLQISAPNCVVDDNDIDVNTVGNWAVTLSATATNTVWGRNLIVGGVNGTVQLLSGGSFVDASTLGTRYLSGANFANPVLTDRMLTLVAPGINRTHTIHTAVGCPGKIITFNNTDATFTWTINPNGTEKIDGANAGITIGKWAVTFVSNGTDWITDNVKANLASPTFTGVPAGPTASPGTNTTQLATTAFVLANAPAATWGGITGTLSSQTDLNTALTAKAPLASPTFTGTPAGPTAVAGTSTTQLATTAFVTTADNLKENTIAAGTTAQYWRGDKTWQALNAAAVGLGNVNNTADTAKQSSSALEFVIYNGGAVIATGVPDYCDLVVPFACTITSWTLLGNATCTIDVWKAPYASYPPTAANSIVGAGTKPNIASGFSGQSSTLTSWTTSISAGDIIRLNVSAASGSLNRANLILNVTRTAV